LCDSPSRHFSTRSEEKQTWKSVSDGRASPSFVAGITTGHPSMARAAVTGNPLEDNGFHVTNQSSAESNSAITNCILANKKRDSPRCGVFRIPQYVTLGLGVDTQAATFFLFHYLGSSEFKVRVLRSQESSCRQDYRMSCVPGQPPLDRFGHGSHHAGTVCEPRQPANGRRLLSGALRTARQHRGTGRQWRGPRR
jgi:hypothetical protein